MKYRALPQSLPRISRSTFLRGGALAAAFALPGFPLSAAPKTGALTRIGGMPVMSAGLEWPRPAPDAPPFAFIAQIDLAGAQLPDMPDEGRLLFFFDLKEGIYEPDPRYTRVLWDTEPAELTTERSLPQDIPQAESDDLEAERAEYENYTPPEIPEIDDEFRALLKSTGMSDAEIDEIVNAPKPEFDPAWVISAYRAPLTETRLGKGGILTGSWDIYPEYPAPRAGGQPDPLQDDPRYDAASLRLFGNGSPNQEQYARLLKSGEAEKWHLLLQMPLEVYYRQPAEGVLYFLIHEDDLAARRFENTVAVYQQT